jgi:hypothetical protein
VFSGATRDSIIVVCNSSAHWTRPVTPQRGVPTRENCATTIACGKHFRTDIAFQLEKYAGPDVCIRREVFSKLHGDCYLLHQSVGKRKKKMSLRFDSNRKFVLRQIRKSAAIPSVEEERF